jgi:hypothetical protein
MVMYDVVQVVGSLLILGGFIASLIGWVRQSGYVYLWLNFVGSAILTATAVVSVEPGFILLEGVWALASLVSIARVAAGRDIGVGH